jgi:hypothetical protein
VVDGGLHLLLFKWEEGKGVPSIMLREGIQMLVPTGLGL